MPTNTVSAFSRRDLLIGSRKLSVAGLAVMAGVGTAGFGRAALAAVDTSKDIQTLNTALGTEHQAIGAYQVGADSGLLKQPALNIALLFQSHHKSHRDELSSAIQKLGGTPVTAHSTGDYGKELNASMLKTQNDFLELALKLELGAANAYINIIPSFENRDFAKLSARVLADESMHWTALASTLAHPLPANAMFFGS